MNELDQFVKRKLKLKFYTRYMDDFIILAKTKKECIDIKNQIEFFLHNVLHLSLNDKSRYYPYQMGANFCGYRIFTTHKLLRVSSKKKIIKKIKIWNNLYKNNKLDLTNTMQSVNSWLGHARHCNSFKLQKKMITKCDFIYTNKIDENIENELLEFMQKDNIVV